ncbi:hypothetical protein M1O54_02665 [Dehalococcoidia bacterium]|nr:hypothetical protein [Dehalococcoidia bacterium]
MKKRPLLAILALLMLSLVAVGCPRTIVEVEIEPPPPGPYPAPPKEWSRTFGGSCLETARSVYQTACGGFIIAGETVSLGAGARDFWLVKTDSEGNKEWSQTFGGPYCDWAYSAQQTADGGFIIAGTTWSFGDGEGDFWLVKTDPQGNKEWSRTFGGPGFDRATSVKQTVCSGFIIAGRTTTLTIFRGVPIGGVPIGVPPLPPPPGACIWVVKTDAYGNKEWTQIFGTLREMDIAYSVKQTACGGFIVAGMTESFGAGEADFWLIKLAPER